MKKFLCYDTNDAASGKIGVNNNGVLSPNATVPSTNGEPYQQLVTDGEGNVKWEDKLAYTSSRTVVGNNWVYVSDEIPDEQMHDRNPCLLFLSNGRKQDSLLTQSTSYILNAGPVMFVLADNIEHLGGIFPKRGVYFEKSSDVYVSGFSFRDSSAPEIAWDGKIENVKTIDPKYIKDMYYDNLQSASYAIYTGGLTEFPRSELDIPLEMWKLLLDENATITDETTGSVMTNRTVVGSAAGERVCYDTGIPGISSFISTMYPQAYLVVSSAPDDRLGDKRTIKVSVGTIKQIDPKYIPATMVIVNIIPNKDGTFSADKTYAEVKELIDNGVDVKCVLGNIVIPIVAIRDTVYIFAVESLPNDLVLTVFISDGGCEVEANSPIDAISNLIDAKLGVIENGSY